MDHQLCLLLIIFDDSNFYYFLTAVSGHHSSIFLKQCKIQIVTIVLLAIYIKHFDEISLKFQ